MLSSKCSAMKWANCPRSVREAMFQLCFTEELPVAWEKNVGVLETNGKNGRRKGFFRRGLDMKRQGIEFNKY